MARLYIITLVYFNPRTHKECDRVNLYIMKKTFYFNPRTHKECDSAPLGYNHPHRYFNPRTHKECDIYDIAYQVDAWNFNPRTHKECDLPPTSLFTVFCISIHALTRSATGLLFCGPIKNLDFNPRTHKECDISSVWSTRLFHRFQSTHSQGVRPKIISAITSHFLISIHALTRSATIGGLTITCVTDYFNPRTHKECDLVVRQLCPLIKISIHALTRSATMVDFLFVRVLMISIHALTRSATMVDFLFVRVLMISIHALTRSATT